MRCREQAADPRNPLNSYCTEDAAIRSFLLDPGEFSPTDFYDEWKPVVVRTIGVQRDMELIRNWLEAGDPFIIVGPEGCGKSLMLTESFKQLRSTYVATFNCNAQTTAEHVLAKLTSICA
jgi:dynein heavy chain 2